MIVDFERWVDDRVRFYLKEQLGPPPYQLVNFYQAAEDVQNPLDGSIKYVARLKNRAGDTAASWLHYFYDTDTLLECRYMPLRDVEPNLAWHKEGF